MDSERGLKEVFIKMSTWTDIKNSLSVVAPAIASAIGGPAAGIAVSAIQKVLGISSEDPTEVQNALQVMTPEQKLEFQKENDRFKVQVKKINFDIFSKEVEDTANARDAEIALSSTKWGWISLTMQNFGAFVVLMTWVGLFLYAIFGKNIDPQNQSMIFGAVIATAGWLFQKWWGKTDKGKD